jgi:hypothetical protein
MPRQPFERPAACPHCRTVRVLMRATTPLEVVTSPGSGLPSVRPVPGQKARGVTSYEVYCDGGCASTWPSGRFEEAWRAAGSPYLP